MAYSGVDPSDIIIDQGDAVPKKDEAPSSSKKMTDKDFQALVYNRASTSRTYVDTTVRQERALATG